MDPSAHMVLISVMNGNLETTQENEVATIIEPIQKRMRTLFLRAFMLVLS
jgi:hypothetical protein